MLLSHVLDAVLGLAREAHWNYSLNLQLSPPGFTWFALSVRVAYRHFLLIPRGFQTTA